MHEGCKLCLVARAGLCKGLLKLTAGGGQCDADSVGGGLQAMTLRNCYRNLRFAISQVESLAQRLDSGTINAVRIADEDDPARGLARVF